ncbi:MAG: carboxypeptidase-like regulatory domain-containing protein [Bacteroidota bacterium]|nr:carboxypeptidase-like regulatory domain-containing protein [Bacteroidota bacterium]
MKHIIIPILFLFYLPLGAQTVKIKGIVTDSKTMETLIGVSVLTSDKKNGTITGVDGSFELELSLPSTLSFTYVGYKRFTQHISVQTNRYLQIKLIEEISELKELNIKASAETIPVTGTQSGMILLNPKQVAFVPATGGEKDLLRVLQLMPGIKAGAEGAPGIYVRGGTADQNLVMLDGAPLYNASHLIGFFSVFNTDAVDNIKMYKGAFPANYGGRLSSVMDVKIKEGNKKEWHTEGGLGLVSGRLLLEGPVLKNKLSLMVALRRTFIEQLFSVGGNNLPYYFYDFNGKLTFHLNEHNRFTLSEYTGKDVLTVLQKNESGKQIKTSIDFGSTMGNQLGSLKWNHNSRRYTANVSLMQSRYANGIDANIQNNLFTLQSKIQDIIFQADISRFISSKSFVKGGLDYTLHQFNPNSSKVYGSFNESVKNNEGNKLKTNEFAFYAMHETNLGKKMGVNYGLRVSGSLGADFLYVLPEPRLNLKYELNPISSLKFSYNKMAQHMHLISGTDIVMPTDLWYPVSDKIKPQQAHQLSIAYQIKLNKSTLSIELYSKWMYNMVEYKEGTIVLLNNKIEEDLVQGRGKAQGMELLLQKTEGKFSGWLGYTLSVANRQFNEINKGQTFYARYDRRHDFSAVGTYQFSRRIAFSASYVYATGPRGTPIIGQFLAPGASYTEILVQCLYGSRNSLVLSPSHRLDLNLVIKSNPDKKWKGEWHIGAYNVYNRAQIYRVQMQEGPNGNIVYNQLGLFGFIPSVTYNFKF